MFHIVPNTKLINKNVNKLFFYAPFNICPY